MTRARTVEGRRTASRLLAGLAVAALLAACTTEQDGPATPSPQPKPSASASASATATGLSEPVEDRVYPEVGDPGVDALHYDLRLEWDPTARRLVGVETVRLRATADADLLRLDLAPELAVRSVRVDGAPVRAEQAGKDLLVHHPVTAERRYTLIVRYAGTPRPVPAPGHRGDMEGLGWTITADGEVWTMQEPYGAYTWYAVNDQPADKATYSFDISAPRGMVGVANGTLVSRTDDGGRTRTRWRLDEPASSYLVTIAIGDLVHTVDRGDGDGAVPIDFWVPRDRPRVERRLRAARAGLEWLERRLGDYPYDSLGFLIVPSRSGMETQTMITLGDTAYSTAPDTIVHELAHQWYGDLVTPVDWRDVWMNEGMAMYLQGVWLAESWDMEVGDVLAQWEAEAESLREEAGPPADFDPGYFGSSNVYYIPALMWDELRQRLGDEEFWALVRAWPQEHAGGNADYDDITTWWSRRSGEDLTDFFADWLLEADQPDWSAS